MTCKIFLLVFVFMSMLNGNLNAQESATEKEQPSEPKALVVDVLDDAGEELDKALDSPDTITEDEVNEERADGERADGERADGERADDALGEDEDETKERENSPISIRVNQDGELIGQAKAFVSGQWLPVEATIGLVSDDVLLNKVVAEEDGSFSFPDIVPGSYKVYGTAASFCGHRTVTVLMESGCCDNVDLSLRQDSPEGCYSELGSAPVATFSQGPSSSGGFASGGGGAGGGAAAGGGGGFVASGGSGVASGISGIRLLAVGGIAAAIAIPASDDDDAATPSE